MRAADMLSNIDYLAPHGGPDNDRKMKEASWLCSQAFIESLRNYPDPFRKSPIVMPGEVVAFDGNTQSARRPHTEHVETAMRRRLMIAPVDDEWMPEQCPIHWPDHLTEGKWRGVGPIRRGEFNPVIQERYGYSNSPMRRRRPGAAVAAGAAGKADAGGAADGGLFGALQQVRGRHRGLSLSRCSTAG